jgi:UDP-2-acetamido-3-amino-2,3-dideoxy-glucuronate N-acetyltransferase
MRRDSRDEITRAFSEIDSGMARRAAGGSDGLSEVFVHESAYVDEGAQIGAGTKIWHFCHVNKGAVIGERCSLGQNVVVMNDVKIGNNVKIQNNVSVYDAVELEDDVFCGPSMVFTNVINPRSHVPRKDEYKRTRVKRGASIGANATIVCGVTLGEYSFIGAGSVVTDDVKPFALIVGVPGRQVGWMCKCGERLLAARAQSAFGDAEGAETQEIVCEACGERYALCNDNLARVG